MWREGVRAALTSLGFVSLELSRKDLWASATEAALSLSPLSSRRGDYKKSHSLRAAVALLVRDVGKKLEETLRRRLPVRLAAAEAELARVSADLPSVPGKY